MLDGPSQLPSTLHESLLACDREIYPNIHTILRIGCTVPVTTCENEQLISRLRILKTYLRCTMGQEWLTCKHLRFTLLKIIEWTINCFISALALMQIHRDKLKYWESFLLHNPAGWRCSSFAMSDFHLFKYILQKLSFLCTILFLSSIIYDCKFD